MTDDNRADPRGVREASEAAALRARINEELGFYPARLDEESIAEYRRKAAEDAEQLARYDRRYGSPRSSHWNQFRHLAKNRKPKL